MWRPFCISQHPFSNGYKLNKEISLGTTSIALAILLVALTILYGTLSPSPHFIMIAGHHTDKIYHISGFFTLSGMIIYLSKAPLVPTLISVFSFGLIVEIIQPYVGRSFDKMDIIANTSGVLIGSALGLIMRHYSSRKGVNTGGIRL